MVDYTTDSGPVTSGDTTVRVGAGASIGGFTSTAFTWTAGGGQMRIWGSLWGETGISKSGSNGMVLIHAGGSIGGSNVAITGTMSQVYNLGSISGRIDSISASFEMENYGTIVHYNSGSGIATHATGSSVIYNSGSISAWEKAISFGNGQSTLINNGLISRIGSGSGDFAVIEALNSASLNLTNKGTIAGQSQAIRTSDLTAQADTVTNSGSITGNIALNGGNDRYDNTYGMTNGTVDMGDGADTASGGVGTDRINGGAGDDTLTGNDGADTLDGGADNDILNGGTGADRLTGGAGNDTFYVDSNQDRAVEATGGGTDTVYASASYTLRAGQEVETLSADLANDAVGLSLAGNELVQTITGDVGDNRITGGGGADTLIGRGGDDLYVVSDSGTIIVEQASDGYDTVTTTVDFTLADNLDALRVVSSVTDGLSLTGNSGANTITGTTGDDIIDGGGGADMMRGGLGNDTYVLDDAGDIVSDTGGMDTVQASVSYVSIHAVEAIVLTGTANIDATGTSAANDIVGNGGDNSIFGKGGLDTLAGGSGADTFVFGVALNDANFAAIGDFEVDLDRIALDDRYFTRIGGPGGLADAVFTEGPATNTDQRIIYDRVSGTLFYDRDGSGAAVAVAFASVAPETLLSAADFFVI